LTILYFSYFSYTTSYTTQIYSLSLHDALPISNRILIVSGNKDDVHSDADELKHFKAVQPRHLNVEKHNIRLQFRNSLHRFKTIGDRKSTRLNSSHRTISYAVFCLKKKKKKKQK